MQDAIILYENGKAIGGEGHPTNASDITFDNSNTDLVSENVEGAIKEVNAKTSGLTRMTKLWENPTPRASFAEQDVTLSSADYDFLIVYTYMSSSISYAIPTNMVKKGDDLWLNYYFTTSDWGVRIGLYVNDTKYHFNAGFKAVTGDNSECIPVAIYGIKLI